MTPQRAHAGRACGFARGAARGRGATGGRNATHNAAYEPTHSVIGSDAWFERTGQKISEITLAMHKRLSIVAT